MTARPFSLLSSFCVLFALLQDVASGQTNLDQKVKSANLIVVGQFLSSENNRRAEAPIKVTETLKGKAQDGTRIVACFKATGLTVSPKRSSKWIFLLLAPTERKDGKEFRKVIGENYDYEGILPATEANIDAIKRIVERQPKPPGSQ